MTEGILRLMRQRCGIDLGDYRAPTLERRIRHRMIALGLDRVEAYEDLLATAAGEAERLLERITIKVSRFYRNAAAFEAVRTAILPQLAARRPELALWSAGSARGEEAYTLAMLLDDAGIDGIVLATDLDGDALAFARRGLYPASAVAELPARLRDRYLSQEGGAYRVVPRLRDRVRFARHDLTTPAAEGPFDLVACRNLLIYWARPAQETILRNIAAATRPGGYVMLGEAEWPVGTAAGWLEETPQGERLFRRIADPEGCA